MFKVTISVMHAAALLPALAMLALRGRCAFTPRQLRLAGSLGAVPWAADWVTRVLSKAGYDDPGVIVTRIFTPILCALVLGALMDDVKVWKWISLGLFVLAIASALQGAPAYDVVVRVTGGCVVAFYAWSESTGLTRTGLMVYFGLGAVPWTVFALAATDPSDLALNSWYTYQATRLVCLVLITMAFVAHARQPRMELI